MLAGQLLVEAARTRLPADAGLARLRARVLAEPERPWTVAEIARLAGWSPSHLRARWRAAFATSPIDEVIAARIERAGWLLAEGTGVAETARRCGFADPRYFARIFRRRTGTVPGRVRRAGP
jgi:AraC-like DNA-binding protein